LGSSLDSMSSFLRKDEILFIIYFTRASLSILFY